VIDELFADAEAYDELTQNPCGILGRDVLRCDIILGVPRRGGTR